VHFLGAKIPNWFPSKEARNYEKKKVLKIKGKPLLPVMTVRWWPVMEGFEKHLNRTQVPALKFLAFKAS
jgi:hypothetical protein